jgi:hypothetical protein
MPGKPGGSAAAQWHPTSRVHAKLSGFCLLPTAIDVF